MGVGAGAGASSEVFCQHRGLQGHVQPRIPWESPSQQESLNEEGLEERGPKSKRSELEGFGGR